MAIQKLQDRFKELIDEAHKKFSNRYTAGTAAATGGGVFMTEFIIGGGSTIDGCMKGMEAVLSAQEQKDKQRQKQSAVFAYRKLNIPAVWEPLLAKRVRKIIRDRTIGKMFIQTNQKFKKSENPRGFYFGNPITEQVQNGLAVRVVTLNTDKGVDEIIKRGPSSVIGILTRDLYEKWFDEAEKKIKLDPLFSKVERDDVGTSKSGKSVRPYITKFREGFKLEHGLDTTSALFALNDIKEESFSIGGDLKVKSTDIIAAANKKLSVKWQEDIKKFGFKYGIDTRISFAIGPNPTDLPTDMKGVRAAYESAIEDQIFELIANNDEVGNPLNIDSEKSKPVGDQIAEDAVKTIIDKVTKGRKVVGKKVIVKSKAKALKKSKRKATIKPKSRTQKGSTKTLAASGTVKLAAARQVRKKTSTDATLDLLKLQKQINRGLARQIKSNMGRPALINQTGRFAESAEVVKMTKSAKSIVTQYTYQLRPYETFENNGDKQWPAGYNPKPLISKSIRELAAASVNEKFVLRRV